MSDLIKVYDDNKSVIGNFDNTQATLLPIGHVMNNVKYEIHIDLNGKYIKSDYIKNEPTVMPSTEDSESRSGNKVAPYPLHDKLDYIIEPNLYKEYLVSKTKKDNSESDSKKVPNKKVLDNKDKYNSYIGLLSRFRDSAKDAVKLYEMLNAVYLFVTSHDEEEKFLKDIDRPNKNIKVDFARFRVIGDNLEFPWKNIDLFKQWELFVSSNNTSKTGVSYVNEADGKVILAKSHPKSILPSKNNAKLISANDSNGFTYRGRFSSADEAVLVGYNDTQKAHRAIQWLIKKQGYNIGSRYFVIFGSSNALLRPNFVNPDFPIAKLLAKNHSPISNTKSDVAKKIKHAMLLGEQIDIQNDNVYSIELDSSSKGRAEIVGYQSFKLDNYIDKITSWCDKTTLNNKIENCGPVDIAKIIYPADHVDNDSRAKIENFRSQIVTDLVHSMLGSQKIPKYVLDKIYMRAIMRHSHKDRSGWEKATELASRLFRANFSERIKEMLDEELTDRSYLFGRLLAIAYCVEKSATQDTENNRITNAERYLTRYSQRPLDTWKILFSKLQPYLKKSKYSAKAERLIDQITSKIDTHDKNLNAALDGKFLIAFSQQKMAWYSKNQKENK